MKPREVHLHIGRVFVDAGARGGPGLQHALQAALALRLAGALPHPATAAVARQLAQALAPRLAAPERSTS